MAIRRPRRRALRPRTRTRTIRERSTTIERTTTGSAVGPLLVGLGVFGLAYWWMNRGTASASELNPGGPRIPVPRETGPETGTGGTSGGTGGTGGTSTGGLSRLPNAQNQAAPSPATVSRLTSDQQFRLIYAFQSLGYSTGLTEAAPDGIMGPKTQQLIAAVNREAGTNIQNIDQAAVQAVSRLAYFRANEAGTRFPLRPQPTWLPEATVLAVNRLAIGYNPLVQSRLVPLQTWYGPTG